MNGDLEQVSLPIEYANHLGSKYSVILDALNGIDARLERAQQIEREYLYKACNGSNAIEGLDDARYGKICTWRDQFKDKYAAASTQYQAQLEQLATSIFFGAATQLAYYKLPGYIAFVSELPLTASNKPQRAELKKMAHAIAADLDQQAACFDLRSQKKKTVNS